MRPVVLVSVLVLLAVLLVGTPSRADASVVDVAGAACSVPGVSTLCDVAGGGIARGAGAVADGVLGTFRDALVDAAVWAVSKTAVGVDESTRVDLSAGFLTDHYRFMTQVGMLVVLPALLVVVGTAVLRGDGGLVVRAVFGYLPASVLLTGIAVVVIQGALAFVDGVSAELVGSHREAGERLGSAVPAALSASSVPVMLGSFVAFVLMAAALVVWLELLVRSAAIQIAVMFLPLFLAGMVWPTTQRYARRLAEVIGALILSKLVVAGTLSLAVGAVASGDLTAVLSGSAMFMLAAFAPFVVLSLIPLATEAGHLSSARRGTGLSRVVPGGGAAVAWQLVRSRLTNSGAGTTGAAGRVTPSRPSSGAGLPVAGRRPRGGGG